MGGEWLEVTDSNGAAVRAFLFDYRKAFDLVDYRTLANKLQQLNIASSIGLLISSDHSEISSAKIVCLSGVKSLPECPKGASLVTGCFCL